MLYHFCIDRIKNMLTLFPELDHKVKRRQLMQPEVDVSLVMRLSFNLPWVELLLYRNVPTIESLSLFSREAEYQFPIITYMVLYKLISVYKINLTKTKRPKL